MQQSAMPDKDVMYEYLYAATDFLSLSCGLNIGNSDVYPVLVARSLTLLRGQ